MLKKIFKIWWTFFLTSWFLYGLSDGMKQTSDAHAERALVRAGKKEGDISAKVEYKSIWCSTLDNFKEVWKNFLICIREA